MSEDRPADDTGEGVDAAVGLSSEALVALVRLLPCTRCDLEANGACDRHRTSSKICWTTSSPAP
jgi:hypothetical protein